MIIFEYVVLEIFELLITEWTSVVSVYGLFDAAFAVDVPASSYIAVINRVQAYCTLKLNLKFLWVNLEVPTHHMKR